MLRPLSIATLSLSCIVACGPTSGPLATEDVASVDARADGADGYPAGPYGNALAATLDDLALEGFVNDARNAVSTEAPYGPYSFAALRAGGARYALVHTSGFL
jgi:hypothetical protein